MPRTKVMRAELFSLVALFLFTLATLEHRLWTFKFGRVIRNHVNRDLSGR